MPKNKKQKQKLLNSDLFCLIASQIFVNRTMSATAVLVQYTGIVPPRTLVIQDEKLCPNYVYLKLCKKVF